MVRAEPLRVAPRYAGSADKSQQEVEQGKRKWVFLFFAYISRGRGGFIFFFIMLAEPDRKPRQPVRLKSNKLSSS